MKNITKFSNANRGKVLPIVSTDNFFHVGASAVVLNMCLNIQLV